jgi:hypothetical protein
MAQSVFVTDAALHSAAARARTVLSDLRALQAKLERLLGTDRSYFGTSGIYFAIEEIAEIVDRTEQDAAEAARYCDDAARTLSDDIERMLAAPTDDIFDWLRAAVQKEARP